MSRQKTYSVSDIEAITGITSHSLRMWERRYDFIKANRSETNIRYYTEEQLRRLLNISFLNKNGIKVSLLDKMTEEEIENKVVELSSKSEINNEGKTINGLIKSMLSFDELQIQLISDSYINDYGFQKFITSIVLPFFTRIGFLWSANRIAPAQEHFVSNLIKNRIIIETYRLPKADSLNKIVLFLPEQEHHDIGLLFSAYLARKEGWKVYYFGQNLPIDSLITALEDLKPRIALGFYTLPNPLKAKEHIQRFLRSINTKLKLVVAGNSSNFEGISSEVSLLSNPEDLIEVLRTMKKKTNR